MLHKQPSVRPQGAATGTFAQAVPGPSISTSQPAWPPYPEHTAQPARHSIDVLRFSPQPGSFAARQSQGVASPTMHCQCRHLRVVLAVRASHHDVMSCTACLDITQTTLECLLAHGQHAIKAESVDRPNHHTSMHCVGVQRPTCSKQRVLTGTTHIYVWTEDTT